MLYLVPFEIHFRNFSDNVPTTTTLHYISEGLINSLIMFPTGATTNNNSNKL